MANAANEMSVFERVAERGSFAAAAEDVGLSPSAVSKLIMRLEQRLGVRLINRTTRRLALTAEGRTYLDRSREILAAIDAAESEIVSARISPRGHLRIHAPPVMIGAITLITDVLFGALMTLVTGTAAATMFVVLWYVLPTRQGRRLSE